MCASYETIEIIMDHPRHADSVELQNNAAVNSCIIKGKTIKKNDSFDDLKVKLLLEFDCEQEAWELMNAFTQLTSFDV